jgi:glycerol uptake facilitator-like aquaporin
MRARHPGHQHLGKPGTQHRAGADRRRLQQLWLFWLAPLLGAGLSGIAYRWLAGEGQRP